MLSADELAKLRFGMSEVPNPGGQPGDHEEKLTQWFLERSFFRDFIYRNPRGRKKGEELADAVVLFDDVAFLVQVKAQHGSHETKAWATEATLKALKQVCATHHNLKSGAVKKLTNEVYGVLDFDPAAYPNMFGIIILAQDSGPFDPNELVPEIRETDFPTFVFSLKDIELITQRFDTAADFVHFTEFRRDVRDLATFLFNDEKQNLQQMIALAPAIYTLRMQPISDEMLARTVDSFRRKASGELLHSAELKYGLVVDDMIARAHDVDPNLPWNRGPVSASVDVARFLGWLSRDRRIKLGKRVLDNCMLAESTGKRKYFSHFQKSRGTVAVYLTSRERREERLACLEFLVTYAHFKYAAKQAFGVATDAGVKGRSYDFILTRKQLLPENIAYLKTLPDPFGDSNDQL